MSKINNAKNPAINTPKTGYSGDIGKAYSPGAFEVARMVMKNSKGEVSKKFFS